MPDHDAFHAKVLEELAALRAEHAVLKNISENTLAQATKTNGRVSKAEERLDAHDISFAVSASKLSASEWWKEKIGVAVISVIIGAMGFGLSLILQKTEIIDVATVSPEVYDSLPE